MGKLEKARELALQGKSRAEIKELVPCGRTTAYKAHAWAQKRIHGEAAEPPSVEVVEEAVEQPPYIEEPVEAEVEEGLITPEIVEKAVEGALTPEDVTQLFVAVNDMIPAQHRRPKEAMNVLGQAWHKPLNRLLAQYSEQNADLIFAVIVAIIVFAPAIIGMAREKIALEKKRKEASEKTET